MNISSDRLYDINDFFESYAAAVELYDAKGMTTYYALPCSFLNDETASVFTDVTKLEGLFNQALVFYKQFGIAHARPEVWSKRVWTDRIVKAKVNWQYYNADNQRVYDCDYHYILRLDKNNKWKIETSVSVNEKQKMEEWQQTLQQPHTAQ